MGDELFHFEVALQVVINETGELCTALDTTEGASFPDAASDELEGCEGC